MPVRPQPVLNFASRQCPVLAHANGAGERPRLSRKVRCYSLADELGLRALLPPCRRLELTMELRFEVKRCLFHESNLAQYAICGAICFIIFVAALLFSSEQRRILRQGPG